MSYLSVLCADLYQYLQRFILQRYVPLHFSLQGERLLALFDGPVDSVSVIDTVVKVKTDAYRYTVVLDEPMLRSKTQIYSRYHQCETLLNNMLYIAYIGYPGVCVVNVDCKRVYSYNEDVVCTTVFFHHLLLIATHTHLKAVDFLHAIPYQNFEFPTIETTHRMCMSYGNPVFWRGTRVEVLTHDVQLHCLVPTGVLDLDADDDGKILVLRISTIELFSSDLDHLFSFPLHGFYFQKFRLIDHRIICVRFDSQLWQFEII